jgi:hypothetical protein
MATLELNFSRTPAVLPTLFAFSAPSMAWLELFSKLWQACVPWPCRLCALRLGGDGRLLVEVQTVPEMTKRRLLRLMLMTPQPDLPVRTLKKGGILPATGWR